MPLGSALENFYAHGLCPAHLLKGANPPRALAWLKKPNTILAMPLNTAHSEENASNFQTNMEDFLERAFPNQVGDISIIPPIPIDIKHSRIVQYAQPWGFLMDGLNPQYADLLVCKHLWICQTFGFIAMDTMFKPSMFTASIIGMGKRLKDAGNIITL
jgi:hypothetical protein